MMVGLVPGQHDLVAGRVATSRKRTNAFILCRSRRTDLAISRARATTGSVATSSSLGSPRSRRSSR